MNVGLFSFSLAAGWNSEVRSPQIARRQELMLVSLIGFPVFLVRYVSRNMSTEVLSSTSEQTQPPRLQGEATSSGTR